MQLVQALKFEIKPTSGTESAQTQSRHRSQLTNQADSNSYQNAAEHDSGLADFLISRAVNNAVLGTAFHWYLMVETEDRIVGKMYGRVAYQFMTRLMEVSAFFDLPCCLFTATGTCLIYSLSVCVI